MRRAGAMRIGARLEEQREMAHMDRPEKER